jgi:hypothetical protein
MAAWQEANGNRESIWSPHRAMVFLRNKYILEQCELQQICYCGLHNFLEMRHVEMLEEDDRENDACHRLALPPGARVGGIGADVRSQLACWVGEQYACISARILPL